MSERLPSVAETTRGLELFKTLEVVRGLDDVLRPQVIAKSRYPHIRSSTPKDYYDTRPGRVGRFYDKQSLKWWLGFHDHVYPLRSGQDLTGLVWFRPNPLPDRGQGSAGGLGSNVAFATRLYEHTGKGISSLFYDAAIKRYVDDLTAEGTLGTLVGVNLETDERNIPARRSYERCGWQVTHAGYDERVEFPDGSSEVRKRVLMELPLAGIQAAYERAAAV